MIKRSYFFFIPSPCGQPSTVWSQVPKRSRCSHRRLWLCLFVCSFLNAFGDGFCSSFESYGRSAGLTCQVLALIPGSLTVDAVLNFPSSSESGSVTRATVAEMLSSSPVSFFSATFLAQFGYPEPVAVNETSTPQEAKDSASPPPTVVQVQIPVQPPVSFTLPPLLPCSMGNFAGSAGRSSH